MMGTRLGIGALAVLMMLAGCARVGFETPAEQGTVDAVGGGDGSAGGEVVGGKDAAGKDATGEDAGGEDATTGDALVTPDAGGAGDVGPPPDGAECSVDAHCAQPEGVQCKVHVCVEGACQPAKADPGTPCDDGDPCTYEDICNVGVCAGIPRVCDNGGDVCLEAFCEAGECLTAAVDCEDGNPCTYDVCKPDLGCEHKPACSDGDPCTDDFCDGLTGACAFTPRPDDPSCSCFEDTDCAPPSEEQPCLKVACVDNQCVTGPVIGLPCDDGDPCTVEDACKADEAAGTTVCAGAAVTCQESGDPCKPSQCVEGTCKPVPLDCDDGKACTTDFCDASVGCVHEAVPCDDGVACTVDTCSEDLGGECVHTPEGCGCVEDTDCNAANPDGSVDPCAAMRCQDFVCVHDLGDGDSCDTGDPCKKTGSCSGAVCWAEKKCVDSDPCTEDGCDPTTGDCVYNDVSCDDQDPCTEDFCEGGACQHVPLDCNDDNPCTTDKCVQGLCKNVEISCDDGNACTSEFCDTSSSTGKLCVYEPVVCEAATEACTIDVCDPQQGCLVAFDLWTPGCQEPATCQTDTDCVSACHQSAVCTGGQCIFSQPVTCPPQPAGSCFVSECFEPLGCVEVQREMNMTCYADSGAGGPTPGTCNISGECVANGN